MSTSSEIRAAWDARVWSDPTVRGWTERVFPYEVPPDAEADQGLLFFDRRVNYFTYAVTRESTPLLGALVRWRYAVTVTYVLQQADEAESAFNDVSDRLDALDALVLANLATHWAHTVDYCEGSESGGIDEVEAGGFRCWRGRLRYRAVKTGAAG